MKYPNAKINFGSFVSRGCQIACSDDSQMVLHNVYLTSNVVLRADRGGTLKIEETYVGFGTVIVALAKIQIDAQCQIAEMAVIRDQDHSFGNGRLLEQSGFNCAPINIGRNVWIGAKATILKGVTIGDNAVIGTNAVVNKDVAIGTIAVGVPIRLLLPKRSEK